MADQFGPLRSARRRARDVLVVSAAQPLVITKKNSPWLHSFGSLTQLTLTYLVVVCPAFWYSRFFGAYVRGFQPRAGVAVVAGLAAVGTALLPF